HLLAAVLDEALEPLLEALDRAARAVDVPRDPGATGPMARALEPARHPAEGLVVCEEAGHEDHRLAGAVGYALSAPDGGAKEAGELEPDSALSPQRWSVETWQRHVVSLDLLWPTAAGNIHSVQDCVSSARVLEPRF